MERIIELLCHFNNLFHKLNHEAKVWHIILPDYLAGIFHYAQCDWLRYLSGQVIPFPVIKARYINPLFFLVKTASFLTREKTRRGVFTVFPGFSDFIEPKLS